MTMLSNYIDIAGEEAIEEIRRVGERLSGKKDSPNKFYQDWRGSR
ncbi:MAG: hypothetical protein WBF08_04425 [Candidatus Bathyarchaeia archaeon]